MVISIYHIRTICGNYSGVSEMRINRIYGAIIAILILSFPSIGISKIEFPFKGQVTGDNVNVRSGPDINYYATLRLMRGNVVDVAGQEYGWYKIVPPEGSFSWVAKSCVEKKENNKGVICKDRVAIRAGSKFTERKTAIQMIAKKGTEIEIIGEQGEYYKIVPPKGAYLWISVDYVKPISKAQISKALSDSSEISAMAKEKEKTSEEIGIVKVVTTNKSPTSQPGIKLVQKVTKKESNEQGIFGIYGKQIEKLDALYKKELTKPLLERDFSRIAEGFKKIANQKTVPIAAAYARQRLELINYQIQAQKGYKELEEIQKEFEEQSKKIAVQQAQTELEKMSPPKLYKAAGVLKKSYVFEGPLMPKRYRLVNPVNNSTIAYVELAKGAKINVNNYLGKYVGVYGDVRYDAKLRIDIIKAVAFKVLRNVQSQNSAATTKPAK